jgi:hypothetical protein
MSGGHARQAGGLFDSPELSLAAKGLLAMLQQHPKGMTRQAIFQATSDPMTRIRDAAKELIAAGLVEIVVPSKGRQRRALDRLQLAVPAAVAPESEPLLARSAAYGRPQRDDLPEWLWPTPAWHPSRRVPRQHEQRPEPPRNAGLHGARELPQDVADPRPVPARGESGRERRARKAAPPTTQEDEA